MRERRINIGFLVVAAATVVRAALLEFCLRQFSAHKKEGEPCPPPPQICATHSCRISDSTEHYQCYFDCMKYKGALNDTNYGGNIN